MQRSLLEWFGPRARPLRIRAATDPWSILVSEVMAQQTQISRVDDAWVVFMWRFPTAADLAAASPADVLRAWAGLGYNRRAINLQRTAMLIESRHGGQVPSDLDALEALPGIGPYTARAVAAIAFGQPVAAVDTNVRRVVTRLLGMRLSPAALQAAADDLVDASDPAGWIQASMDLGATVCKPARPACEVCPLQSWCRSAGAIEHDERTGMLKGVRFERTTRWLRGRIVEQLRAVPDDTWTELPELIGDHGPNQIDDAVAALERDGLVQRRPDGQVRLPSGPT